MNGQALQEIPLTEQIWGLYHTHVWMEWVLESHVNPALPRTHTYVIHSNTQFVY